MRVTAALIFVYLVYDCGTATFCCSRSAYSATPTNNSSSNTDQHIWGMALSSRPTLESLKVQLMICGVCDPSAEQMLLHVAPLGPWIPRQGSTDRTTNAVRVQSIVRLVFLTESWVAFFFGGFLRIPWRSASRASAQAPTTAALAGQPALAGGAWIVERASDKTGKTTSFGVK